MTSAYPLQWPDGWPRTHPDDRYAGRQFLQGSGLNKTHVTLDRALRLLEDELVRLGAEDVVVCMNKHDDVRRAGGDPGVGLFFTDRQRRQMAMACDSFHTRAANLRSLGLAIEAMRQLERHGGGAMMERAFAGFAALPRPRTCWEILAIKPGAAEAEIRAAFKDKAMQSGAGGNVDMDQLVRARDEALKGRAA